MKTEETNIFALLLRIIVEEGDSKMQWHKISMLNMDQQRIISTRIAKKKFASIYEQDGIWHFYYFQYGMGEETTCFNTRNRKKYHKEQNRTTLIFQESDCSTQTNERRKW